MDVPVLDDQQELMYLQQVCTDTEYSLEDLLEVMDKRERKRERGENPCLQHDIMMMMWE